MTLDEYMKGLQRSISNLVDENERLAKELAEVQSKPDERDELINLLAQDIEWKEAHGTKDERLLRAIELYRKIRPKE